MTYDKMLGLLRLKIRKNLEPLRIYGQSDTCIIVEKRIFEETLGRPRKKGEVIHHIDRNPKNNSRDNLIICTQSYHMEVLHKDRTDWIAHTHQT